jgi:anthranilate phosphoribosyltransferase
MPEHLLVRLVEGTEPSVDELRGAFLEILDGHWSEGQIAALLTALRTKPLRAEHLTAGAQALRDRMTRVTYPGPLFDTCGTGGDRQCTINISTAVAFVMAAAGVPVAKHGNRSVSSTSGSADVLTALGVQIDLPAEGVSACLAATHLGFCFAQRFHPRLKALGPLRKALGFSTVLNLLGPLANPASTEHQLVGVGSPEYQEPMAGALGQLGTTRSVVIHGEPRLDEVSLQGETRVYWAEPGQVRVERWTPEDFGLPRSNIEVLRCTSAAESADRILSILRDEEDAGSDWVVANTAAGFLVAGRVKSLKEGVQLAGDMIRSGQALETLERLKEVSTGWRE